MKIKLLQLICLIMGVGFLSFGAGLLSGRVGAKKQQSSLAPALQTTASPNHAADILVDNESLSAASRPQEPQIHAEETTAPVSTPLIHVSSPVKEPAAPVSPSLENSIHPKVPPVQVKEAGKSLQPKYVVQVLSTPNRVDAASVRNKMMGAGLPAGIFEVDLGAKGKWYRIYVGPYDTEPEAQTALESVRGTAGFTSGFVKTLE
jgi:cell division septation protein DedD